MVCIYCGGFTSVTNSRHQKRENNIWRRRKCLHCAAIFTTIEQPELTTTLMVVSRAGERRKLTPFNRDRLFISIYDSCRHRPTAAVDTAALTKVVLGQLLLEQTGGTLSNTAIARITHTALQRLDPIAAGVYAGYHADNLRG